MECVNYHATRCAAFFDINGLKTVFTLEAIKIAMLCTWIIQKSVTDNYELSKNTPLPNAVRESYDLDESEH